MLTVNRVEIMPGRMRLHVSVDEEAPAFTNSQIAASAVAAYPELPVHSCINPKGPAFGDVLDDTSTPHLLEHLIIAEQAKSAEGRGVADAIFVGTTEWASPGHSEAITEVSFLDDMEAVSALNRALAFINSL